MRLECILRARFSTAESLVPKRCLNMQTPGCVASTAVVPGTNHSQSIRPICQPQILQRDVRISKALLEASCTLQATFGLSAHRGPTAEMSIPMLYIGRSDGLGSTRFSTKLEFTCVAPRLSTLFLATNYVAAATAVLAAMGQRVFQAESRLALEAGLQGEITAEVLKKSSRYPHRRNSSRVHRWLSSVPVGTRRSE
jgi:hypothetical protein